MSKKNKEFKRTNYRMGDGSVVATITANQKKGKLKGKNKKETRILKGACTHHIIGKNGKKILAINTENTFPKLDEVVALIYFMVLPNTFRPAKIPFSRIIKSFSSNTISALSFAISKRPSLEGLSSFH